MKNLIKLFLMILLSSTTIHADNVNNYREHHRHLLAKQEIIHERIGFQEQMFKISVENNEIFTSNWNNNRFNPYETNVNMDKNIDLRDYVKPIKHGSLKYHFAQKITPSLFNDGVDFEYVVSDTIVSSFSGKVRMVSYNRDKYGFYVIIRHPNGLETLYSNLSRTFVKPNDYVQCGQVIGYCHRFDNRRTFHYEIRYMGKLLNPEKLINFTTNTPLQAYVNAKTAIPVAKQQTRQVQKKRKR